MVTTLRATRHTRPPDTTTSSATAPVAMTTHSGGSGCTEKTSCHTWENELAAMCPLPSRLLRNSSHSGAAVTVPELSRQNGTGAHAEAPPGRCTGGAAGSAGGDRDVPGVAACFDDGGGVPGLVHGDLGGSDSGVRGHPVDPVGHLQFDVPDRRGGMQGLELGVRGDRDRAGVAAHPGSVEARTDADRTDRAGRLDVGGLEVLQVDLAG